MAEQMLHDSLSRVHSTPSNESDRSARELVRTRSSRQDELDRKLDRALEETFPASDPVSILVAH